MGCWNLLLVTSLETCNVYLSPLTKVFVVTMVVLGPAGCGKGGQYTHDPAGDTALPYKHDPAGDTALPYKHDPAGDKALPYKHDPAGVSFLSLE